jgi:hypothetical protein
LFNTALDFTVIKGDSALRSWNPMKNNEEIRKYLGFDKVTQSPNAKLVIERIKKSLDDLIAQKKYEEFVEEIERLHLYIDPKMWMEMQNLFLYEDLHKEDGFDHAKSIFELVEQQAKGYATACEVVPKTFCEIPSKIILDFTFKIQAAHYIKCFYFWLKNCHEKLQVKKKDHKYRRGWLIKICWIQAFSVIAQIALTLQTCFDAEFWLNLNWQNICFNSIFAFGLMIYHLIANFF